MPLSALLLALVAAAIHAMWNLLLSDAEDTHGAAAVTIVAGVIVFAPVVALTWRLSAAAIPYIVASSVLEGLYLLLLATGYSRAAASFVYPIARGSAPVIVLVISVVALGAGISVAAGLGVVLVALGIVLVRGLRREPTETDGTVHDLAVALSIGACIAGYTLVDKHGITHGAPLSYLEVVMAITATGYLAGTLRALGPAAVRAAVTPRALLAGIGFFGAYAVVLLALQLASAASVAAVRESSVVMATAVLALRGRERVTLERLVGSAVVLAGILLISVG